MAEGNSTTELFRGWVETLLSTLEVRNVGVEHSFYTKEAAVSLTSQLPQHQGTTGLHRKGDPIPWLLEEENPSVRYLTLTHLLDRPEDDLQVAKHGRPSPAPRTSKPSLHARTPLAGGILWNGQPGSNARRDSYSSSPGWGYRPMSARAEAASSC